MHYNPLKLIRQSAVHCRCYDNCITFDDSEKIICHCYDQPEERKPNLKRKIARCYEIKMNYEPHKLIRQTAVHCFCYKNCMTFDDMEKIFCYCHDDLK